MQGSDSDDSDDDGDEDMFEENDFDWRVVTSERRRQMLLRRSA